MDNIKSNAPGVGIDMVQIARVRQLLQDASPALERMFTKEERVYAQQKSDVPAHLAGIFAAKEAASKALGVVRYPFFELAVLHDSEGAPYIIERATGQEVKVSVSISHEGAVAVAVAVAR